MKLFPFIPVVALLAFNFVARAEVVSGMSVVVNDDVITYGEIADRLAPTKKETKRDTILLTPKMKRLATSPAQLRAKINLKGLLTSTACDLINMGLFGTFCFADEMYMECHCKRHALAGGKVAKMT